MANLLVEIGNTALKAAWSERMTLGKTYRYQGEKYIEFIQSLTQREKPAVMVVSSVYPISQADESILTDGKVDLGKLRPIIFDPSFNAYRVVGEVVGKAFSDGMKLK